MAFADQLLKFKHALRLLKGKIQYNMLYKLQTYYWLGMMGLVPFLPILHWQGKRIRANIPDLGEAQEPQGVIGEGAQPIRLLAIGESAIAGVGVRTHKDGMVGHMAAYLSKFTGRSVNWEVVAKSGYTARQVNEILVPKLPEKNYDLLVIGLGGNDTFQVNSPLRWRRDLEKLLKAIRLWQPGVPILFSNLPPVGEMPAFSSSLKFIFRKISSGLDQALAQLVETEAKVWYCRKQIKFEEWRQRVSAEYQITDFFSDGVHPSSMTYRLWGEELANFTIREMGFSK